ncbi:hypothetical protein F5Y17DRAFT_417365 [Xylariaceae sp. FL0594]|nr:hypothetical protein F5Y17DRAFT_417365 [Xylariaceae sp. FL0594]
MPTWHETFKALGPIDWDSFAQEDQKTLMINIFSDAYSLIESVPVSDQDESQKTGRPTAGTDTAKRLLSLPNHATMPPEEIQALRKEWKDVKVNSKDNPLGLSVYKLPAKDGKGAWFARRSTHKGLSFDRWKTGMEREFGESLKVQGEPGDGKIRGLGADKRVVDQTIDGCGKLEVYQLSARFPGPATPRDFVTLCLSSDTAAIPPGNPRDYMLVSKPCAHPECPERQGYIRGTYESVEFIREIGVAGSLREVQSPPEVTNETPTKDTIEDDGDGSDTVIEWVMITRSDPGGSVPRFMIERGTPPGIANDANKFWQWISSSEFERVVEKGHEETGRQAETTPSAVSALENPQLPPRSVEKPDPVPANNNDDKLPGPGGVYGMVSGALSAVAAAAASKLLGSGVTNDNESSSSDYVSDDASSSHSFHSCDSIEDDGIEQPITAQLGAAGSKELATSVSTSGGGNASIKSTESSTHHLSHHEKELKKLEERQRKAEEKLQRARERALAKRDNDAERDELAFQKLQEKHEKELAKQEEKYQRERRKLEAKRLQEERKAREKKRKQQEKEEKANITLQLQKVTAERDLAGKEIEILKEQVGQLQELNTKLVARLGREGVFVSEGGEVGEDIEFSKPELVVGMGTEKEMEMERRASSATS